MEGKVYHLFMVSSGDVSLRFTNQIDYDRYSKAIHEINMQYYHEEVQKYGYYASNQDRYVSDISEFNDWDGTRTYESYERWLAKKEEAKSGR